MSEIVQGSFHLECFQNEYLAEGATEVNAVVSVSASQGSSTATTQAGTGDDAEVIIVDTSFSMGVERKIDAARQAAAEAITLIRDGVKFALIAGESHPTVVYPRGNDPISRARLAVASAETRAEAIGAALAIQASGGTAIGSWLECAADLVRGCTGIRHAILLTDGIDQEKTAHALDAAIRQATGVFQCDCRGVGTGWDAIPRRRPTTAPSVAKRWRTLPGAPSRR